MRSRANLSIGTETDNDVMMYILIKQPGGWTVHAYKEIVFTQMEII